MAFAIIEIVKHNSGTQSKLQVKDSIVDTPAPMEGLKGLARIIARSILVGTRKHSTEKTLEQRDEFENIP